MYCRLCDIEYPKSLRFCKWCGGGLVAREAVGNQHCPSCSSEIEREWVFCNECGVDLATLGAQPRDVVCPACSATVRKGWMFCRQCGEQVATERAAERCADCGAGIRSTWTFCKQCAARLKEDGDSVRQGFRTVAGIPALPPEGLEDAPFSNLRSGELPPLEDVIRSGNRGAAPPPAQARPSADPGFVGGTHPLTSSRSTGHLDAEALEREIRAGRPVEAPTQPAPFGRLEASELIQPGSFGQSAPQSESPRSDGEGTRAYSPVAEAPQSWKPATEPQVAVMPPAPEPTPDVSAVPVGEGNAGSSGHSDALPYGSAPASFDGPALDATQAFSSPFVPPPPPSSPPDAPPSSYAPAYPTDAHQHSVTHPPLAPQSAGQPSMSSTPTSGWQPPQYSQPPPMLDGSGSTSGAQAPVAMPGTDSYGRNPTVALPAEMQQAFPSPALPAATGSGSAMKWMALVLVVLAVFVVGGVGAIFAYRAWKAKQVVVVPPAPVPTPTPAPAPPTPQPVAPQLTTLLAVAGATYGQGTDDNGADDYSKPEHQVTVKPFYIEATEVTNEQYKVFVDKTGHTPPKEGWVNGAPKPGTENWPVIYVTWDDATAYAQWAGRRLPTESEWELAARGTDERKYPWGNDWDPKKGNLGKDGNTGTPEPVGSHPDGKSPSGAFDMLGNVWEWTSSPFSVYPGGKAAPPEGDGFKIIRGGAFDNVGKNTVMYRGFFKADSAWPKVGFRCAKDTP